MKETSTTARHHLDKFAKSYNKIYIPAKNVKKVVTN